VKAGDFFALALACTVVQAANQPFELIPIALQRGCAKMANSLQQLRLSQMPAQARRLG
jgi:hypothetical protein